ncbi:MAG: 1-acyl-sn-glycerol-3-phosphate acyltransferase [Bacteroidota bacterium]
MENKVKQVDIKQVFSEKNPALAKLIPGFVFKYLKRIVHEDFVNSFLDKHGDKEGIDFVRASIIDFDVNISVRGEENIPEKGLHIFASNHPLGGFDGLILLDIISRHYDKYKFLVNDILMNIPQLRPVFIPINKHGSQAIEAARQIDAAFNSDTQILTFPAGLVSRKIKGRIVDLKWHKNFISKAKKYKRDIIPVHVSGRNTNFFYRLANIRKSLGIKANIEMLYLMDETYRHMHKHIVVTFGEPIPYSTFDNSKSLDEWAFWVKQKTYKLGGNNLPDSWKE